MANNPFDSQKYQNFLNWFKDCKSNPYNQNTYLFGEGLSYYEQLSLIGSFLYDLKEYITTSDWTTGDELQAIIDQIEAEKQNVLISGENIKTINSESILSAGNLDLQEKLIAGQNIVISPDGKTISASGTVGIDYPNVSNKPQINGQTLQSGNNTLDTLGIQAKDDTILFQVDVIDNLISEDTTLPLSANQGRILDETKQDVLVSGLDIKTLNEIPLLGEGNIPLKTLHGQSLIGSEDILFKTVGSESIFGRGNIAFKTINSQSLMGEGNISLQEVLTAGTGIDITGNEISNKFQELVGVDLNNIKYNFLGYVRNVTNGPTANGLLISVAGSQNVQTLQIFRTLSSSQNLLYTRFFNAGDNKWTSWEKLSTISTPTITIGDVSNSNIIAKQQGDVVFLDGYVVSNAKTYTANSTVLFTTNVKPSANRFFPFFNYSSAGPAVYVAKWQADGKVVLNNTITFDSTTYLFFNAALPL